MKEWRRGTVFLENWIERATKVSSQALAILLCAILGGELLDVPRNKPVDWIATGRRTGQWGRRFRGHRG